MRGKHLVAAAIVGGLAIAACSPSVPAKSTPSGGNAKFPYDDGTSAVKQNFTISGQVKADPLPPHPAGLPVLSNSCSGGHVTFTFDDGPSTYSLQLASELKAMRVPAVFFVIGYNVVDRPGAVKAESDAGFVIGDHTYNHPSLTGQPTASIKHWPPMTSGQVKWELATDAKLIVAAGAPRPTMWRPPYGNTDGHVNSIAASLGLRLVMPFSLDKTITDNGDWAVGATTASVINNVTRGWSGGAAMHAGSIIAGHDGISESAITVAAMPSIVRWMNAHSMCATSNVPAATGGFTFKFST